MNYIIIDCNQAGYLLSIDSFSQYRLFLYTIMKNIFQNKWVHVFTRLIACYDLVIEECQWLSLNIFWEPLKSKKWNVKFMRFSLLVTIFYRCFKYRWSKTYVTKLIRSEKQCSLAQSIIRINFVHRKTNLTVTTSVSSLVLSKTYRAFDLDNPHNN